LATTRKKAYDPNLVVWQPHPGPQTSLLTCPAWEIFFGGARGGGKTDAILGEFIGHAQQYGEGASGLVVRRTRVELLDAIERSRQLYTPLGAKFNQTDALWRFSNGARLQFIYLEQDSDADRYQGRSITRLYVEEAGTFPSEKPLLKLIACLRSGTGVPTKLIMTGNPGGPGQHWIKTRYIDPNPLGNKVMSRDFDNPFTGETLTKTWSFIPSRVTDNPSINQSEYVAQLQMLGSAEMVRAWLLGDWDAVPGAFFDCWSVAKHVVLSFHVPEDWHRFRSMDWGSASPSSIGWWAVASDETPGRSISGTPVTIPRGCLVRYREWYVASAPNEGLKLTAEEIAEGILARETPQEHKIHGVLDPSAFKEDGGPSHAERMARLGVHFREADNKRLGKHGAMGGWDQMRSRLIGDSDGNAMAVCFDTCAASIRTIPVLQHDPDNREDLNTDSEDHAADEWRYACMSRPYVRARKSKETRRVFKDYRSAGSESAGDWRVY
jgi:hypothetical protein